MSEPAQTPRKDKELMMAALELPSEERVAFLAEACGSDPSLKALVLELLKNVETDGGFMARPAVDLNATTAMSSLTVGGQVGRYKLLEQIGEGGMGVVFVAEQLEPVRRKVALKVIKPGMDSRQVIARFEAERQALALMDHENIARVLDGGTTEQGLPYFVMELVRGLPITQYCDQAKSSTRQRLELFMNVCSAVQHAHQKGIIHRDIKPSNVMITLHDGQPVVKVIDFGVAKALHQQLSQQTIYTALNQIVGTPLYMSPEQMELSGLDIDTRTDVYSLGVLLYELLTGETPFSRERLMKSGFDEMRRIIREEEPQRPSYRITTLPKAELSTLANKRGLDDRSFSKSVQGELDWITLKALEKDRYRRFESASAFRADIQRYLNDEPVLACPPSWIYQLKKLTRRHRGILATVGSVFIALLGGLAIAYYQLQRAVTAEAATSQALAKVQQKAEISERRLAIAERAVDEMYTQFASEWLSQQAGLTDVQRSFLEKAVVTYEQLAETSETDELPRLSALESQYRLGSMYIHLGRLKDATKACEQAIEQAKLILVKQPENIDAIFTLIDTQILLASNRRLTSNHEEKIQLTDEAFRNLESIGSTIQLAPEQMDRLAKCYSNVGSVLSTEKTRKELAAQTAAMGVSKAQQLVEQFPNTFDYRLRLAKCYSTQGQQLLWWGPSDQDEHCLSAYESCLEILSSLHQEQPDNVKVLSEISAPLNNAAMALKRLSREDEIPELRRRQLEVAETLCSQFPKIQSYKDQLKVALFSMAAIERNLGHTDKVLELNQRNVQISTEAYQLSPSDSMSRLRLLQAVNNMAIVYLESKQFSEAIQLLERYGNIADELLTSSKDDLESLINASHCTRKLVIAYIANNKPSEALISITTLLALRQRISESQTRTGNVLAPENYSGHLFNYMEIAKLLEFLREISIKTTIPVADREALLETCQKQSRNVQKLLDGWVSAAAERILTDSKPVTFLYRWADKDDQHKMQNTLEHVTDNAVIDSRALFFDACMKRFNAIDGSIPDLPGILILISSEKGFTSQPSLLLELAKRALTQSPNNPLAQQAMAWALFRNEKWQECLAILNQDTQRGNPENGFVRSMAIWQLGDQEAARQAMTEAASWYQANIGQIHVRANASPDKFQPDHHSLARLKWEAEQLLTVENASPPQQDPGE